MTRTLFRSRKLLLLKFIAVFVVLHRLMMNWRCLDHAPSWHLTFISCSCRTVINGKNSRYHTESCNEQSLSQFSNQQEHATSRYKSPGWLTAIKAGPCFRCGREQRCNEKDLRRWNWLLAVETYRRQNNYIDHKNLFMCRYNKTISLFLCFAIYYYS